MSATATGLDYRTELLQLARELAAKGPGYAQEGVLLRCIQKKFNVTRLSDQQKWLDQWQLLFQEGRLMWGYDIENPGRPWFHFPRD